MAVTYTTRDIAYALTTTPIAVSTPQGGQVWTIGNTGGSDVYVMLSPTTDAAVTAFNGNAAAMNAAAQIRIGAFERAIIPASVPCVALVMATGATGGVIVQSGEQDAPEPAYVATALNLAKNGTRDMLAAPGANYQTWLYLVAGTTDGQGTVTLLDSQPTNRSGAMPLGANGGIVLATLNKKAPLAKCTTNKILQATLSVNSDFDGIMVTAPVKV